MSITWEGDKGRVTALASMSTETEKFVRGGRQTIKGSTASYHRWKGILPNISVRDEFDRSDYEWFRSNESLSNRVQDIIATCICAYEDDPIVHNVIDLMSEFASQGIKLAHKTKKYEKIAKYWFNKVNGKNRTERFLNLLYKGGQVPVLRTTAKLKLKDVKTMQTSVASADLDGLPETLKLERREIPYEYTFFPPNWFECITDKLGIYTTKHQYGLRLNPNIKRIINDPGTEQNQQIAESIMPFIKTAKMKDGLLLMDDKKFKMYYYKKDDLKSFAMPMTRPILRDLITLKKMKLADECALDGAISHVRVWKLGSLEHKILPDAELMSNFEDVLLSQTAGGTTDIIWNPAIELLETKSDLANFLGPEKCSIYLSSIYAGLGVPPTLTGDGGGGGFTNNFISMKTLIERLKYGRDVVMEFWKNEIRLFQEAMDIPGTIEILFDYMTLSDESSEKALWIQLVDRNIISMESLRERFGLIPEIEQSRINKEYNDTKTKRTPPRISPYHDGQPDLSLEKIALQTGVVTPSQVGLELEPKQPGEETLFDLKKLDATPGKPTGQPGQGRPLNSKDKIKRKQKTVKPRSGVSGGIIENIFAGRKKYSDVSNIIEPIYLKMNKVADIGELEPSARKEYEKAVFSIMCGHIDKDVTINSIRDFSAKSSDDSIVSSVFDNSISHLFDVPNPDKTEVRETQGVVYSLFVEELINQEEI